MKITLHGIRGSIPTTNPETKKYGGNTSCIEVEAEGWRLILDAGSGMHNVDTSRPFRNNRVDILLTHLHMDHIQGLGFFKPLFNPEAEIHIWGPASNAKSLRARLGRYFSPPLFPVYFRNLTARLVLHEMEDSRFEIGPFTVDSRYVIHPGPTVGLRIEQGEKAVAYIPDHEPALGRNGMIADLRWLSGADLAKEADLLLHDAQYTADEYQQRIGWGHSSLADALRFGELNRVKKLLFIHHDPSRTDKELSKMLAELHRSGPAKLPYDMAREGWQVML